MVLGQIKDRRPRAMQRNYDVTRNAKRRWQNENSHPGAVMSGMPTAVKWVYRSVTGPQGQPLEAGQKPALCFRGRKYMLAVATEYPIRVLKRPVRDFDALRPVTRANGTQYTVEDAVAVLRSKIASHGITRGALTLLDRAATQGAEVDDESFNDEEQLMIETETVKVDEGGVPVPADTTQAPVAPTEEVKAKRKRVAKTKAAEADTAPAPKAAKKKATAVKKTAKEAKPKGEGRAPSKISQMVEWMCGEIKKQGGVDKLERGWLKNTLFPKAAEKFGLSVITASIQYGKQIRNG